MTRSKISFGQTLGVGLLILATTANSFAANGKWKVSPESELPKFKYSEGLLVGQFNAECDDQTCFDFTEANKTVLRAKRTSISGGAINLEFEDGSGNLLGSLQETRNWLGRTQSFMMLNTEGNPIARGVYRSNGSVALKAPSGQTFGKVAPVTNAYEIQLVGKVPSGFDGKWILALSAIQSQNPIITRPRVIAFAVTTAVIVGAAVISYKFIQKRRNSGNTELVPFVKKDNNGGAEAGKKPSPLLLTDGQEKKAAASTTKVEVEKSQAQSSGQTVTQTTTRVTTTPAKTQNGQTGSEVTHTETVSTTTEPQLSKRERILAERQRAEQAVPATNDVIILGPSAETEKTASWGSWAKSTVYKTPSRARSMVRSAFGKFRNMFSWRGYGKFRNMFSWRGYGESEDAVEAPEFAEPGNGEVSVGDGVTIEDVTNSDQSDL